MMDPLERLMALGVLAIVVVLVAYGCSEVVTENRCAARGWPGAKVTWSFDRYCVRRIDQTDSVIPLRTLERSR